MEVDDHFKLLNIKGHNQQSEEAIHGMEENTNHICIKEFISKVYERTSKVHIK